MKIVIAGGTGHFGTALGNVLSQNQKNDVILLGRNKKLVEYINKRKINIKRYPSLRLNERIKATMDPKVVSEADILILALPSGVIPPYLKKIRKLVSQDTIIVNVAKGFGRDGELLPTTIRKMLPNEVVSLKGPTFASELIRNVPSGFTVSPDKSKIRKMFKEIFRETNVFLDFFYQQEAVELVSILKNIYAIAAGVVDAYFNSANVRALLLVKSLNEMRQIIKLYGYDDNIVFKYCGIGDLFLTSFHDLSRNRTLGLMIGKGFLTSHIESSVVLEGKRAVKEITRNIGNKIENSILFLVYKIFYRKMPVEDFIELVFK